MISIGLTLASVAAALTSVASGSTVEAATPASMYVPVEPCRLLDTRDDNGQPIGAHESTDVTVADRCGVVASAVAASVTVTAVRPQAPGFAVMYPAGTTRPTTSTVNYQTGQVVANGQLTQLGEAGRVSVYTLAASHVVVDVNGYFIEAPPDGARSGRFHAVEPYRAHDTRDSGRPAPGGSVRVAPDVPADAIAVAANITTTATAGPDFFSASVAGGRRPDASVLNVDGPNQTRAAFTIVPVGPDGLDVHTLNGSHVIVDITGYFTGPSAVATTDGLFVASEPVRLLDTRLAHGVFGGPRLWDHGAREFGTEVAAGGPVAAVAANITVTQTEDAGVVAVYPARTSANGTSAVNYDTASRTVANLSITPVSRHGLTVAASEATHIIVDITGWFLGSPVVANGAAPVNEPPGDRRVTIISDSAMAGVRWNGALGGFQGFDAIAKLESCRRLVQSSCRGREGSRPPSAAAEINALPPAGPEDLLVVAVGYNDWHERFSSDFDIVVGAARAKGFHHIVWVNYRSHVGYFLPGSGGTRSNYGEMNTMLAGKVVSGAFPDVRVWDLDRYTNWTVGWFSSDGVHETQLGSWAVADWISRHVRAFDDRPCVQPWRPFESVADPCPDPDGLPAMIGHPDIAALYGL